MRFTFAGNDAPQREIQRGKLALRTNFFKASDLDVDQAKIGGSCRP